MGIGSSNVGYDGTHGGFGYGSRNTDGSRILEFAEDDVIVNPQLSAEQKNQVKDLLVEYKEIFSDVPKVTHLIEHKVELTETEPVKRKPYPIPYKMQEAIDKEHAGDGNY